MGADEIIFIIYQIAKNLEDRLNKLNEYMPKSQNIDEKYKSKENAKLIEDFASPSFCFSSNKDSTMNSQSFVDSDKKKMSLELRALIEGNKNMMNTSIVQQDSDEMTKIFRKTIIRLRSQNFG